MKNGKILFIVIALFVFSCSPKMQITNVLNTEKIDKNSVLYVLPKTVVSIKVTVQRKIEIPGPYSQYAGKFLGTKNVISKKSEKWKICNFDLTTYETEDKTQYYIFKDEKKSNFSFSNLTEKGLIYPVEGMANFNAHTFSNPQIVEPESKDLFPDFLTKENLVEREKTVYETVRNDSAAFTVQTKQKLFTSKTEEEKAQEAADLLTRLRKRRFKLIASIEKNSIGDDVRQFAKEYPDGAALNLMLKELEQLETEIEASFKGKTVVQEYTYYYEYSPSKTSGKYILFSFSEQNGIQAPEVASDKQFTIRFNLEHNTAELAKLINKKEETVFNYPVVRIPDYGNFIIESNNDFQASKRLKIFQFGNLVNVNFVP